MEFSCNVTVKSVIYWVKKHVYPARTEHIDVGFHMIRELVSLEKLFEKVRTSEKAADILKNHVVKPKFEHFLNLINVSK